MKSSLVNMQGKLYGDQYIYIQNDDPDEYEYGFMQARHFSEMATGGWAHHHSPQLLLPSCLLPAVDLKCCL